MAPFNAYSLIRARLESALRTATAILSLLASLCVTAGYPVRAADDQPSEYQVKAAFLLNFTKFVEWPATAFADEHSPLAICILGEDPFGNALNQIVKGEAVNGRELAVERIRRAPSPKSCQVLFVAKSEKEVPRILAGVGPGVLTVGDQENFLQEGGMVAFVIENRRVRFDIRQSAAGNAMLTISSRLMNVARSVEK
jgi:hypothetical protein